MNCPKVFRLSLLGLCLLTIAGTAHAQETQWKVYIGTGWKLCREGDAAAKDYLLKALQLAEEFPADDPRRALTHSYLAMASFKQGQRDESDRYARQALAIYDRQPADGASHPTAGKGLNTLAMVAQGWKDYDQADRLYKRAIIAEDKALGLNNKLAVAQVVGNRASLLEAQGRYEEAEGLRKRQLSNLDTAKHPALAADAHQQFGRLYRNWNKDEYAEAHFQQAIALHRKDVKDGADLADCVTDLGRLYMDRGQHGWAEPLLREAVNTRTRLQGKLPPEKQTLLAESLHNLGSLYLAARHYDRGEPHLRDALAIREKAAPAGDLRVAATLHNLGTLHEAQKKYPQAEAELKRALAITEKALGADHLEVAAAAESLATLYTLMGNAAEAERHFRRALAIAEAALGTEHRSVAATKHNLANFYRDQKRYADAEPLYRHALAVKEKAVGADHATLAPVLENYAQLLQQTKRVAEAAKLTARAKAIRAKPAGK